MTEHLTTIYIIMMTLAVIIFIVSFFSKSPPKSYRCTVITLIFAYVSEIILATAIISAVISFIFNDTFNYLSSDNHLRTFAESYAIYQILVIIILQVSNNQKKEGLYTLKNYLQKVKSAVNLERREETIEKLSSLSKSAGEQLDTYRAALHKEVYTQFRNLICLNERLESEFDKSEERFDDIKDKLDNYLMDIETDENDSTLLWSSSFLLYLKKRGIHLNIN